MREGTRCSSANSVHGEYDNEIEGRSRSCCTSSNVYEDKWISSQRILIIFCCCLVHCLKNYNRFRASKDSLYRMIITESRRDCDRRKEKEKMWERGEKLLNLWLSMCYLHVRRYSNFHKPHSIYYPYYFIKSGFFLSTNSLTALWIIKWNSLENIFVYTFIHIRIS